MKFNASKSYVTIFSSKRRLNFETSYCIGESVIQPVDCVKYLGVWMQGNLHWDTQISTIVTRANRMLGLLRSTLTDAPSEIKKLAYTSLCRPLLEYASEVWDPYIKKHTHDLEMVQNRAVRFILNIKGRDTSITEAKDSIKLKTLATRRKENRLKTLLNILDNEVLHPSLSNVLTEMLSKSSMSTRNQSLNPVYCRTNIFLNSFLPGTARDLRQGDEEVEL